ncbi:sensor histidine kinase [Halorientalis salina]|uniref:sensor histidine kinase n=1 Tax=Halorientalis salina TaxID=2932266 RepID=UPI0010AD2393|nr:PAS domain-containing sensor histidine kinase [Halorientalis salina]
MDPEIASGFGSEQTDTASGERAGSKGSQRFENLFENLQDAVVEFEVVEDTPIVRAVNPAFVELFGYERDEIRGSSLNEYIVPEVYASEAETFDTRTNDGKHNKAVVRRETAYGLRRFLYRGVPFEGADGRPFGFAIYSDITDETRREHRLQVLHRLLRHNLRNNLTVIDGLADELARTHESESVAKPARMIREQATELGHLSSEAGRVQRILDRSADADRTVDVAQLCDGVVSEYRSAHPDAEIGLDVPATLSISASEHLELALQQLVENAIEHNDSPTPRVRVSGRETTGETHDWVDIRVADDGPRIPDGEQQVIDTEPNADQLSHGSGLGLRLVQWITDAAGGTVTVSESEFGGNLITLRFKRSGRA